MKYIVAIIQPDRLDHVLDLLEQKEIHLVTVTSVLGRGRQKGIAEIYRSHVEAGSLLRKIKLEIAVNDEFVKGRPGHHRGRPHGQHRRRQDLRARTPGRHPRPHRRNREGRHRLIRSSGSPACRAGPSPPGVFLHPAADTRGTGLPIHADPVVIIA
jgi:hypothetical protein